MSEGRIVYSWSLGTPAPPRTIPAILGWTNELLISTARELDPPPAPPLDIRRSAVFAWLEPDPPGNRRRDTVGRTCYALTVTGAEVGAARIDLADPLLAPTEWRSLTARLADQGFDPDLVEEEITPVTDPFADMVADRSEAAVSSTAPALLAALSDHFHAPIRDYLRSWVPLSSITGPLVGEWEAVVSSEAIISVDPVR